MAAKWFNSLDTNSNEYSSFLDSKCMVVQMHLDQTKDIDVLKRKKITN